MTHLAAPHEAPSVAVPHGAVPHVALVEDHDDVRLVLSALLEEHFRVSAYEHGAAALAGVARERPDVVLLDVSLPEMDGVEVVARLRANPALAALPVVALTAMTAPNDRARLRAAGFDDHFAKPVLDFDALTAVVRRWAAAGRPAPA